MRKTTAHDPPAHRPPPECPQQRDVPFESQVKAGSRQVNMGWAKAHKKVSFLQRTTHRAFLPGSTSVFPRANLHQYLTWINKQAEKDSVVLLIRVHRRKGKLKLRLLLNKCGSVTFNHM